MASLYSFGQEKVVRTGLHFEKALTDKKSLVPVFKQGINLNYGPKLSERFVQEPSSGEESEIEI
jgi:hypothetical protein